MNTSKFAIASLFLTIFVDAAGIGVVFPALTPMLANDDAGLFGEFLGEAARYQIYGVMLALYPLGMFVGSPFLGDLSDRVGRKSVLLVCLGGNVLGMLGTAFGVLAGNLWLVLIGRAICGLTAASLPVAQAAIIDISTPANKSRNLSMITAANGIGFVLGPVIGGAIPHEGSLGVAFPFVAIAVLAAAAFSFVLFCYGDSHHRRVPTGPRPNVWSRALASAASPTLRPPLLILAVFLMGYYIFFNYMSAFSLLRYDFDAFSEAMLLSTYSTCFAASLLFVIPTLTRIFSPKQNLIVSLLLQSILTALVLAIDSPAILWTIVPLLAVAVTTSYVTLISIASDQVSDSEQGQVMGVTSAINALAWGVAPIVTLLVQPYSILLPVACSALVTAFACALAIRLYSGRTEADVRL